MQSYTSMVLLIVCFSVMTSLAMQSGIYVVMTNSSTNTQVCSTDPPSQVLLMCPGGENQCGVQCMTSSCPYYQFKSSSPIQCELYNQFPWNFTRIDNCIGYSPKSFLTECSFPFTYNGALYNTCIAIGANGVGVCFSVNRTTTIPCTTNTVAGVINTTANIGNQSVSVQSIAGWIIWMRRVGKAFNWTLPWASFQNGIGTIGDSNYWLGLERLYQLTNSSKYRLRIEMKVQSTQKWISAEYWSFSIGSNTTKYQLRVDGYSGDALNTMQYVTPTSCSSAGFVDGMKFSTFDADNDLTSGNCAISSGGGWWFNNCYYQCMTCNADFRWGITTGTCNTNHYLDEARMMMKPQ